MFLKNRQKILFIFLLLILLATILLRYGYHTRAYEMFFDWVRSIDRNYYNNMKSIKIGMEIDEVISLLGEPDQISKEPQILETHGRFGSGSHYGTIIKNKNRCLIYYHGTDIIGHYFIDEEGKVYFVNVGGT